MSEYQYYEFLAIDRPLSKEQMAELRALSTRATITSTRFQNEYNWGNFRGNPEVLMEKYFDAHVYVANWGTRVFMLRLPERLLDRETTASYCACDWLDVRFKDGFAILEFRSEEEEGEWEEGDGWMESLVPVRAELASGDLRALYLGWLLCVQNGFVGDEGYGEDDEDDEDDEAGEGDANIEGGEEVGQGGDQVEPPVPAGLGTLSASLRSLVEFLRIDEDLVAVAAERSAPLHESHVSSREIAQWIAGLPDTEKNSLLVRLVAGEPNLNAELLQRFRRSRGPLLAGGPRDGKRTVAELLAAAEEHARKRRVEEERRAAEERARVEREKAAARARYLDGLVGREEELWLTVDALVDKRQGRDYDQATQLVQDLHDLAGGTRRTEEFNARLAQLRQKYAGRPTFVKRLDAAGLKAA